MRTARANYTLLQSAIWPRTAAHSNRILEVVRSVDYAALLDEVAVIMEHLKKLTALVHRIADLPKEESARENSYRMLRNCARDLLREINPTGKPQPNHVTEPAEGLRVWLCRSCGQIEAPQTCLGVCIRPVEEYVRAKHYNELLEQMTVTAGQVQKLSALARRLALVSPAQDSGSMRVVRFNKRRSLSCRRQTAISPPA